VVEAIIPWARQKRILQFELKRAPLSTNQRAQVYDDLSRHGKGVDDPRERMLVVSRLYNLSLQQTHPGMSRAERQAAVKEALTRPGGRSSDPQTLLPLPLSEKSKQDKVQPSRTLGVSPLLFWIKPRRRKWLATHHHIDIAELERASARLFHGLTQFERHPPEADFKSRAKAYTTELIAHHLRVQRVGKLLGERLGEAIVIQTELCIETLRNQRF
jgi:hypothetical protein